MSTAKTVVNKINAIDNKFRTFSMELLAGEPNYIVECREHGITYKFDFSKVYWNPRLGSFVDSTLLEYLPYSYMPHVNNPYLTCIIIIFMRSFCSNRTSENYSAGEER